MHSVSPRKSGLRAVLDSNILARFLLTPRGFSGRLLSILETGGFTLVTCEAILKMFIRHAERTVRSDVLWVAGRRCAWPNGIGSP